MSDFIEAVVGVESLYDALKKLDPNYQHDPYAAGKNLADSLVNTAKQRLSQANQKQQEAEQEVADAEEKQKETKPETPEAPKTTSVGSPRDDSGIRGMKNEQSTSTPAETDGSEVSASPQEKLPMTKSWFIDNFGMTSTEMIEILTKAEEFDAIDSIQPLIHMERKAILKQFEGVDISLAGSLPLTDLDYDLINQNPERYRIHLLQLVKAWTSSNSEDDKTRSESIWRNRINKTQSLSPREATILSKCAEVMYERGPMNVGTLKSYGISAPSKEISKLIKSHGFLYDIVKAGQGKRADERSLFYDVDRPTVLIKNTGRLISSLLDTGGKLGLDPRGVPRIILPFDSVNAPDYADAIKAEMGVSNVRAEGSSLVIEGEKAVHKALEWAIPSLGESKQDGVLMKRAIEGDMNAGRILLYNDANSDRQVELMKEWGWSVDKFAQVLQGVMNNG